MNPSRYTFADKIIDAQRTKNSILCVGLDPQLHLIPTHITRNGILRHLPRHEAIEATIKWFNRDIIDATAEYAIAYKPQSAFYEAYGSWGIRALEETLKYLRERNLPIILDGKRGDGGDTAAAYAGTYLGEVPCPALLRGDALETCESPLRSDALTIHGYIGNACVRPFVERIKAHGTGAFVVCKTSFKPQSLVEELATDRGMLVWQELARMVSRWGEGTEGVEGYRNLGVVLGATYPEDAAIMRMTLPTSLFLVPGYGAQGGGANDAVASVNSDGFGCIVNSSRGIIYASTGEDFAEAARIAARDARDALNIAIEKRLSR